MRPCAQRRYSLGGTLGQCVEEALGLFPGVRFKVDGDVVADFQFITHRFQHVGRHEDMTTQNRQLDVHHLVLLRFRQSPSLGRSGHITNALNRAQLVRSEDGPVELERLLGIAHEIQVGADSCHGDSSTCLMNLLSRSGVEGTRRQKSSVRSIL
jgi:hypothetical protein